MMTEYIQVMTTVEKREDAERLAALLVEKRLAACVQISGPVNSVYHWQGAIEQAGEYLCLIKSRTDLFFELEETITTNHPYDVPEILAVPILAIGAGYRDWLAKELKR